MTVSELHCAKIGDGLVLLSTRVVLQVRSTRSWPRQRCGTGVRIGWWVYASGGLWSPRRTVCTARPAWLAPQRHAVHARLPDHKRTALPIRTCLHARWLQRREFRYAICRSCSRSVGRRAVTTYVRPVWIMRRVWTPRGDEDRSASQRYCLRVRLSRPYAFCARIPQAFRRRTGRGRSRRHR